MMRLYDLSQYYTPIQARGSHKMPSYFAWSVLLLKGTAEFNMSRALQPFGRHLVPQIRLKFSIWKRLQVAWKIPGGDLVLWTYLWKINQLYLSQTSFFSFLFFLFSFSFLDPMHFYPKIDIYFLPKPRSSTFNMEKQSYENSRDITLGITTFGAKYFSPEASCRGHTLETIYNNNNKIFI